MKKRSEKIVLSKEVRLLKTLRLENKLSMAKAAELMGVSTSIVAHVETGRVNPPRGHRLERFLKAYGGIKIESFHNRLRDFQPVTSPREEVDELLNRANHEQMRTVLAILKGVLG